MRQNIVKEKSFEFSIQIVNLCRNLREYKNEFIISRQLLRSGTSIGANIEEAVYGESEKDFIHKMSIALKEAGETEYWLKLLKATNYLDSLKYKKLSDECITLKKILISIVKSTKRRK